MWPGQQLHLARPTRAGTDPAWAPIDNGARGCQPDDMSDQGVDGSGSPLYPDILDEIGEASFPASDPPQSWTWETGPTPPPEPESTKETEARPD